MRFAAWVANECIAICGVLAFIGRFLMVLLGIIFILCAKYTGPYNAEMMRSGILILIAGVVFVVDYFATHHDYREKIAELRRVIRANAERRS